jgi:polysaccharide export outer membrane protein
MAMNLLASFILALTLLPQAPASQPSSPAKPQPPATGTSTAQPEAGASLDHYVIGANDQLQITVYDEPDLTNKYRVDETGFVTFPLINRVMAAGLTIPEFQEQLRTMLANGYIRNPQVRVDIEQYKSQSVMVLGAVRSPQKLTMSGSSMTLLEALALAGSPTAEASNEVIVIRKRANPAENGDTEEIRVNRRDLELGRAGRDLLLRDGDIINVPTAQKFYIYGEVRNSGTFVLDPGMTVQQAIALAGGLTERGSDRRITARRMVKGKLTDIDVRLEDKVQAEDTITVRPRFF